MRAEELEKVLDWHFRNVDSVPGGRKLYSQRFPSEYNSVIGTLSGKTGFVIIAETDTELVGYISVSIDKQPHPYRAELCGFYVVPQYRRQGYGRALAEKAVVITREKKAASLSVEVGLQKPWLISFYESVGFVSSSMRMYQSLE
jgi:ribosomal protein S18 acetylase RimI-like enzyme